MHVKKITLIFFVILIIFDIFGQNISNEIVNSADSSVPDQITKTNLQVQMDIINKSIERVFVKVSENVVFEKVSKIIISLFPLCLSVLVVILNYRQNKKKNEVEVISKARIQWINELRKIFSEYVYNITNLDEINQIYKSYNEIRVYLNLNENAVKVIFKKIEVANKISEYVFKNREYTNNLIKNHQVVSEVQSNSIALLEKALKIPYSSISEEEKPIIGYYLKLEENERKLKETIESELINDINQKKIWLKKFEKGISEYIAKINLEINSIKDNDSKYDQVFSNFESNLTGLKIEEYLKIICAGNIAKSFNNYLKVEWETVKSEVKNKKRPCSRKR